MFRSCSCKLVASDEVRAGAIVVQTVIPTELVRISFPSFKTESCEPLPSTGPSLFAIQTTVETVDLLNHIAKQKALSPTERNPAEYSPFAETNMSFGFSTDREVPLSVSKVLEEDRGRVCNRHRKRKKNEVSMRNARGIARSRSIYLLNVIHSYRIYIFIIEDSKCSQVKTRSHCLHC